MTVLTPKLKLSRKKNHKPIFASVVPWNRQGWTGLQWKTSLNCTTEQPRSTSMFSAHTVTGWIRCMKNIQQRRLQFHMSKSTFWWWQTAHCIHFPMTSEARMPSPSQKSHCSHEVWLHFWHQPWEIIPELLPGDGIHHLELLFLVNNIRISWRAKRQNIYWS